MVTTKMVLKSEHSKMFPLFTFNLVQNYPLVPTPNSLCFLEFQGSKRPLPDFVGLTPSQVNADRWNGEPVKKL
jgi:hypothetical protein